MVVSSGIVYCFYWTLSTAN